MPAEFFALANAFFFALHNMLTKKGPRYSEAVPALIPCLIISGLLLITIWK